MNRRGFFRTIAGAIRALVGRKALPPAPVPEVQLPASYQQVFAEGVGVSLRVFNDRYLLPAVNQYTDEIDRQVLAMYRPNRMRVRFDPARLPL